MADDSKVFEQVVAYLFRAKHDVKIDCEYSGKLRKRQIDGYHEELLGNFEIEVKIGIECRKRKGKVRIRDVEAFSKTIERCGLDKGIMVSFSGYQAGALDEAKVSRIGLFEFRPCVIDDFKKGTKVVDYLPIQPGYWKVSAEITGELPPDTQLDTEKELIAASLHSFHGVDIYDENGIRIGKLDDIVSAMINREFLLRGVRKGTLYIDWSSVQFFMHSTQAGKKFVVRVSSLVVTYQLPDMRKYIKPFNPSEWYIMKDVIRNSRRLIPLSRVQEIEGLYRDSDEKH